MEPSMVHLTLNATETYRQKVALESTAPDLSQMDKTIWSSICQIVWINGSFKGASNTLRVQHRQKPENIRPSFYMRCVKTYREWAIQPDHGYERFRAKSSMYPLRVQPILNYGQKNFRASFKMFRKTYRSKFLPYAPTEEAFAYSFQGLISFCL